MKHYSNNIPPHRPASWHHGFVLMKLLWMKVNPSSSTNRSYLGAVDVADVSLTEPVLMAGGETNVTQWTNKVAHNKSLSKAQRVLKDARYGCGRALWKEQECFPKKQQTHWCHRRQPGWKEEAPRERDASQRTRKPESVIIRSWWQTTVTWLGRWQPTVSGRQTPAS